MQNIVKGIKNIWTNLSNAERFFVGVVIILIVAVLLRFSYIKKEVQRGINIWFKDKTEKTVSE